MELQEILNLYATSIFRRQADYDYIAARASHRMRLRQQFLWSAQQSIEKYLKAILLFNGKSARYYTPARSTKPKEFGHDLEALIEESRKIAAFTISIPSDDEKFIPYLSKQGGANRYISKTAYSDGSELDRLDSTVWHVRRYCQDLTIRGISPELQTMYINGKMIAPSDKNHPHKFTIAGGELENIVKRQSTDHARKALVWSNLYFGAKHRKKIEYRTFASSETPPNEWLADFDWSLIKDHIKL